MIAREYPIELLQCGKMDWQVMGGSIEGLRSIIGDTPDRLTTGRGGLWRCAMSDIWLETVDEKRAWRALRAQMRNGSLPLIVPVERVDWLAQPLYPSAEPVPYSTGAFHSNGAPFQSGLIGARVLDAAVLGAVEIRLRVLGAQDFGGAEVFTLVHPRAGVRLHEIGSVLDVVPVANGYDYRLEINPPLREAIPIDMEADFNNPRCEMKLLDPNGMPFDEEVVTFSSVTFIEDHRALATPPA